MNRRDYKPGQRVTITAQASAGVLGWKGELSFMTFDEFWKHYVLHEKLTIVSCSDSGAFWIDIQKVLGASLRRTEWPRVYYLAL